MKPHPRIRKTIKWGGAAATVLIVALWASSRWWTLIWRPWNEYIAVCEQGRLYFDHTRNWSETERIVECRRFKGIAFSRRWSTGFETRPFEPEFWQCTIPLWPLAIPFVIASPIAWRLDTLAHRRSRAGLCPKCGYDRAGIAGDAKCPECGARADGSGTV